MKILNPPAIKVNKASYDCPYKDLPFVDSDGENSIGPLSDIYTSGSLFKTMLEGAWGIGAIFNSADDAWGNISFTSSFTLDKIKP